MDLGLAGKRALITGASRGIGAAVARSLAAEGCNLWLVARDTTRLEELKADILSRNNAVDVQLSVADMRDTNGLSFLAAQVEPIDILINNAGDIPHGTLLEVDDVTWRKAWDLKVFGYINLTREVYREMELRKRGVIVNIVGTAADRPRARTIATSSGNAALIAFTRGLGGDSVNDGIRVVAVNPGATETDRQVVRLEAQAARELGDKDRWRELTRNHPFGRLSRPDEVAAVVTFLASERASYVSGTVVVVDGGAGAGHGG